MVRILVTGASGQLGKAVRSVAHSGYEVIGLSRQQADVRDREAVRRAILEAAPDCVLHAAAATDVDRCELEPDNAFQVNAAGTRWVARAAAESGATMMYVSTNFVFDGKKDSPYHEFDRPAPISIYGASKLAGEQETIAAGPRHYIIRTAQLYAEEGRNFVKTMLKLMESNEQISVVDDQFGNPTYARDLAVGMFQLLETYPPGIYHLTNAGSASWWQWAREIAVLTGNRVRINPIPGATYQRAARPPANGRLCSLLLDDSEVTMPEWQDGLRRCLRR